MSSSRRLERLLPLLVAVATIAAFLPALRAGFVSWDDDKNFLANPDYRGLGAAQLRWMWSTTLLGHYVPLSWMTLGLDYVIWGMNPLGYHLTSLLIHAANAVLLYFIALRVLSATAGGRDSTTMYSAAFAALLFAIHPLRVESVVWVTERRDVLSGFFYFATVLCYLRWAGGGARANYVASLALFVCALLSKGTAVTVPIALLALDVYPLRRIPWSDWFGAGARRVYLDLTPFIVLAAAGSALALVALQSMTQLPVSGKIAVSAYSLAFYVYKTIVPIGLSPIYAMPEHVDPTTTAFVLAYATVLALAVAAWVARKRVPALTVALLAFVGVLFPMLGFHQNGPQIAADRYTYHAAPVLALLAAGALMLALKRSSASGVVAAGVLAALGVLTWNQTGVWKDSTSLWSHVLATDSSSAYGHNNWGNLLLKQGKIEEAGDHYARAVALAPGYAQAHNNLGITLARRGRLDEAIREYQRAVEIEPGYDEPRNNWGIALSQQGRTADAIEQFRLAAAANRNNPATQVNWGNALVRAGSPEDAASHYKEALRIKPDDDDAHLNWGVALAQRAKWSEAIAHFRAALAIDSTNAEAKQYLERALSLQSKKP